MAPLKVLAGVLLVALGVSASPFNTKKCDFSGIDLDYEVEKLLEKFPKSHSPSGSAGLRPLFAGIEIGDVNATGFNRIRRYGPVVPYCFKGKNLVQVDLINMGEVQFVVPWRSCTGQEGKLSLDVEYSRFTAQLLVDTESTSGRYLGVSEEYPTLPVNTYGARFHVEGLGHGGRIASGVLSKIIPELALDVWTDGFFQSFHRVLQGALEENNEVL